MRTTLVGCTAAVITMLMSPVSAQDAYPSKPVRLIAPFPPGGTTDVLSRIVAQKLADALGRAVPVENRPGAGGNIGHEAAAKSPADGYTLAMSSNAALVTNPHLYKRLGFDPYNDFDPISIVAYAGQVLVVHPSVPAKTVSELVALAKARPGQLTFGSGGKGTPAHVAGEIFKTAGGIDILHIPYKGGIQAVTDCVGGQIAMVFSDMVPAVPQIKTGRLRALAVTSERRSSVLPDVPTMPEANVKGTSPQVWWALIAPKGTPRAIINRLNTEIANMMKLHDVQERYAGLGVFTGHTAPERVTELMKIESPQMGKVLKAAGVEPE
jgi:tripartite-type tricarboxylate transporter receptor subunit TctC